jgi:hypothetical protein
MGAHAFSARITRSPAEENEESMIGKTLATLAAATGAAVGVTACTPAVTACTVRHHYAIVTFENGGAGVGKTFVTQFRLNVKYSRYYVQHSTMRTRIVLKRAQGNKLPVVVKTYWVGHARSCRVDKIRSH